MSHDLSRVVANIRESERAAEAWPEALKSMTEALAAAGAACIVANKSSKSADWVCFSGLSERFTSNYVDHFASLDPFLSHLNVARRWIKLSDCLPHSLLRQSEWYNDFVLACGVRDILGARLIETRSHLVYVGVHQQSWRRCRAGDERADLALEVSDAAPGGGSVWPNPSKAESESKGSPNKVSLPRRRWRPIFGRDGRGVLLARGSDRPRLSSGGGADERRGLERLCHNRDRRGRRHGRAIAGVKSPAPPPVNMGKSLVDKTRLRAPSPDAHLVLDILHTHSVGSAA
jgi:hypothetical protein